MQHRTHEAGIRLVLLVIAAAAAGGCASFPSRPHDRNEVPVAVADLSPAASATVEKVTAGGQIDSIDREVEHGQVVYDVEATVGGRHLEFLIRQSDGAVLGTEVPISFSELPQPVQSAAQRHFGVTESLTVMKGVEFGQTQYEIEGPKNGKTLEATFDAAGNLAK